MKNVDDYLKVRHAVRIGWMSGRASGGLLGFCTRTVKKMMNFSVPPGYRRKKPPAKPKLDPFIPVIERILRDDKSRPKKQFAVHVGLGTAVTSGVMTVLLIASLFLQLRTRRYVPWAY